MTFKEYRKNYQYKLKDDVFVGYFFSVPVSWILNQFFYSQKLIPNYISFAMFCCGVIGGIAFAFDNLPLMIIGYILMHFWFVFDAWDGAVARQTKKFSKYGKEFDYVVHLLVHPIMIFGIAQHSNSKLEYNLFICYLVINILKRGMYLLSFSRNHERGDESESKYPWYYYIIDFFSNAPNFILIAPIMCFIQCPSLYLLFPFVFFDSYILLTLIKYYIFGIYLKDK